MKHALSYRSGFHRLWILASVGWLAFGVWYWSSDINYAVRYQFSHNELAMEHLEIDRQITEYYESQRDELLRKHSGAMQGFKEEAKSEYGRSLQAIGHPLTPPKPDERIADLSKHISARASTREPLTPPDLFWLVGLFGPPIALFVAASAMFRVARWVWRGFTGK